METTSPPSGPQLLESISVVLPAHNEEENIREAVHQALAAAECVGRRQEVVVVDDGSSDRTGVLAADLASQDARVRLVSHQQNLGYGAAVRSGIEVAQMEWVFLTDADLQFDLGELADFAPHTAEAPLVIGYRANRNDPIMRRVNATGWNALVRVLFHLNVHDVDAAFKLIRRSWISGLELESTGATIDAELLAKASKRGAWLVELPVTHLPRVAGTSSGADMRVIGRAFRELFAIWWHMHRPAVEPLPSPTHSPVGS